MLVPSFNRGADKIRDSNEVLVVAIGVVRRNMFQTGTNISIISSATSNLKDSR